MTKNACRRLLKERWAALPPEGSAELAEKIRRHILSSPEWAEAELVLGYLAFRREISLDKLLEEGAAAGKGLGLPRLEGPGLMSFRLVRAWRPGEFELNSWGIREPSAACPPFEGGGRVLLLTPGLGFTPRGRRMGRGGGFYDRFLAEIDRSRVRTMGICCDACLEEAIPWEPHDETVDAVCTESGIIRPETGPIPG